MKTLAELQRDCTALGITVSTQGRASKEPYIAALRIITGKGTTPTSRSRPRSPPCSWELGRPRPRRGPSRSNTTTRLGRPAQARRGPGPATRRGQPGPHHQPLRQRGHLPPGRVPGQPAPPDDRPLRPRRHHPGRRAGLPRPLPRHRPDHRPSPPPGRHGHPVHQPRAGPPLSGPTRRHRLRFHAFDILKFRGTDPTPLPLRDRLDLLAQAIAAADNPYLEPVPTFTIGRLDIHRRILDSGGEGTVWKRLDQPYEPGRRVTHWLKRKRETTVEAFVTGFKPGTPGHGHEDLVGAVEFSTRQTDGSVRPVAWVSAWSDSERRAMTQSDQRSGAP